MRLFYGNSTIDFQPDAHIDWHVLPKPDQAEDLTVSGDSLQRAIADLIRQLEVSGACKGDTVLLVVPDHTRRCRIDEILALLLPELDEALSLRIRILIANGSHALQPEDAVRELIGGEVYDCYPVTQHDCCDEQRMEFLGATTAGTPISINRAAMEADWIITIGGILFHYFAGYGGGAKMLLPGIAGRETIRINHRRTLDPATGQFHPDCRDGNIATNPVYSDLVEICAFFPRALSLQVVLTPLGEIAAAAAGPILPVQRDLLPLVRRFYSIPLSERADIVIASAGGYPGDVNLIQSHKSIHHAYQAVKPGATLIVLAECREGIGSATFMEYFTGASAAEMGDLLLRHYLINGHTALALKTKTEGAQIILVSALAPELVRRTGMIPAASFAEAWRIASSSLPAKGLGYILPHAARYLPVMV